MKLAILPIALALMMSVAVSAVPGTRPQANYDWKATWLYDDQTGAKTLQSEVRGTNWMECTGTWNEVENSSVSTTDPKHTITTYADTAIQETKKEETLNFVKTTTRWACSNGVQAPIPAGPPSFCIIPNAVHYTWCEIMCVSGAYYEYRIYGVSVILVLCGMGINCFGPECDATIGPSGQSGPGRCEWTGGILVLATCG